MTAEAGRRLAPQTPRLEDEKGGGFAVANGENTAGWRRTGIHVAVETHLRASHSDGSRTAASVPAMEDEEGRGRSTGSGTGWVPPVYTQPQQHEPAEYDCTSGSLLSVGGKVESTRRDTCQSPASCVFFTPARTRALANTHARTHSGIKC